MNIILDDEFAALCPPLSNEEREQLEANMKDEGCIDPLCVWKRTASEAVLLDGYNRYAICASKGLPFTKHVIKVASRDEAKAWIIQHQLGRRNLSAGQRAMLAATLVNTAHGGSRSGQVTNLSLEDAAKQADVGTMTIRHARKVIEDGDPALQQAVRDGEVAVSDAASVAELPPQEQLKALKKKTSGKSPTLKAAAETRAERLARLATSQNGHAIDTRSAKRKAEDALAALVRSLNELHIYEQHRTQLALVLKAIRNVK